MLSEISPEWVKTYLESSTNPLITTQEEKLRLLTNLLVLREITGKNRGLFRVKNDFEDTLQVIHERVRATENAYKAMSFDADQFDPGEMEQFKAHKKVRVFKQGVQALLVALTLLVSSLETAEQLDSQFQMDFEAILAEANQLKLKLTDLKRRIEELLDLKETVALCDNLNLVRDGVVFSDSPDASLEPGEITFDCLVKAAVEK